MRVTRVVDLSLPVGPSTATYPGDPLPELRRHSTVARDGFNLLEVRMGSQTGTHVDAPRHLDDAGPAVDELDLGRFVGRGVVVDATGLPPRGRITREHLRPVAHLFAPGVLVLLRTDWDRHYGTPLWFAHPFLDVDACREILDAGVRTVLLDVASIDETPDDEHPGDGYPCHLLVAAAGGVIGENLRNLAAVDWPDPLVSVLPLRLEDADGAPVRAVALQLSA